MNYLHEKIILIGMIPGSNKKTGAGERILLGGFDRMQATFVSGSSGHLSALGIGKIRVDFQLKTYYFFGGNGCRIVCDICVELLD